jgi:phosphoserine phosphatase RsbU/P
MEDRTAMPARKTIGFIINATSGSTNYENDLWTGAHAAAESRGADLVVIAGGDFIEKSRSGKADPRNALYDLFRPEGFDAVVLASTSVLMGLGPEEAAGFVKRFDSVPFVMINGLKGRHRSLVDNRGGVYASIDHLVKAHGRKRIGYIRGPEGTEADERFEAYKRALADNGLPYDERLVYVGKFLQSSGVACAKELVDERKADFDAIGAANDSMAIGMIMGLRERGIRVPEDVAVVGFDDMDTAAFNNPPLTTVRQPVYGQAFRAVEMACDIAEGRETQRDRTMETELVLRRSCGCSPRASSGTARPAPEGGAAGGAAGAADEDAIALAIRSSGLSGADAESALSLASSIFDAIKGARFNDGVDAACARFEEIAVQRMDDDSAMRSWRKFLRELSKAYPALATTPDRERAAEILSLRLELSAGEIALREAGKRRSASARNAVALRWLSQSMGSTYETEEIVGLLDSELRRNGIPGYSLALAVADAKAGECAGGVAELRQVSAFADGSSIRPREGSEKFPASLLFERRHFSGKRRTIVVYPLTFGARLTGVIAMESAALEGSVFDAVARQLSSSLEGARLLAESRESERLAAERAQMIGSLARPMISSLDRVAGIASGKSDDVRKIAGMAAKSYGRLDGTIRGIGKMSESIADMAGLIEAIEDVSVTIDLVSLNASIEASHAGQFGRGFSVIAKEIKKLSESTQANSALVSNTIAEIKDKMRDADGAGRECLASYREEESGVADLIKTFESITSEMQSLAEDGRRILAAMK